MADIEYTLPELFNQGLQKKFETALAEHPEADAVVTLYDGAILYAIAPVLQQVHRTNMLVAGGEGYPDSLDLIRAGKGQSCAFAVAVAESGYPIADELIRLFAHKPPVGEGIGLALIDNQHNLSRTQKFYDGFFPYAAYYTRLWHRAGER